MEWVGTGDLDREPSSLGAVHAQKIELSRSLTVISDDGAPPSAGWMLNVTTLE